MARVHPASCLLKNAGANIKTNTHRRLPAVVASSTLGGGAFLAHRDNVRGALHRTVRGLLLQVGSALRAGDQGGTEGDLHCTTEHAFRDLGKFFLGQWHTFGTQGCTHWGTGGGASAGVPHEPRGRWMFHPGIPTPQFAPLGKALFVKVEARIRSVVTISAGMVTWVGGGGMVAFMRRWNGGAQANPRQAMGAFMSCPRKAVHAQGRCIPCIITNVRNSLLSPSQPPYLCNAFRTCVVLHLRAGHAPSAGL